jgi:hypothetical protein
MRFVKKFAAGLIAHAVSGLYCAATIVAMPQPTTPCADRAPGQVGPLSSWSFWCRWVCFSSFPAASGARRQLTPGREGELLIRA